MQSKVKEDSDDAEDPEAWEQEAEEGKGQGEQGGQGIRPGASNDMQPTQPPVTPFYYAMS